jgi:hypothetical protein
MPQLLATAHHCTPAAGSKCAWETFSRPFRILSARATLGRKKTKRGNKTLKPQTPSSYKHSPCHVTLRKQEDSCNTRPWLQTSLGDAHKENWMLKE